MRKKYRAFLPGVRIFPTLAVPALIQNTSRVRFSSEEEGAPAHSADFPEIPFQRQESSTFILNSAGSAVSTPLPASPSRPEFARR